MNVKKYLEEYKIQTADKLVSHIAELKRNTSPDFKLISELVHHLESGYNDFGIYKDDVIASPNRGEKEMFKLQENKDAQEKFTKCVNYIYREKPKRPKNVIVSITEKVNSNKNNTSYLNQPKIKEISLKELKENTINDVSLGLNIGDILGISLCDNKEYIHRLVEKKTSERCRLNAHPLPPEKCVEKEIGVKQNQTEEPNLKVRFFKKDIDTGGTLFSEDKLFSTYEEVQKYGEGNNYTEWYKLEHQIENNNGIKETEGKLYYELSWEFIEEMAKRMANNKSNKYPLFNWKKNINVEDLKNNTENSEVLPNYMESKYVGDLNYNNPSAIWNKSKNYYPHNMIAEFYKNLNNSTENSEDNSTGIKDSQNEEKAPIFTYCKVNKHALEALAMRALYGHKKYEKGDDWENFSRVPNGDFEYSNSMFRHALGIGEDTEEEHLISTAWNAVARLEIYFRKKLNKS